MGSGLLPNTLSTCKSPQYHPYDFCDQDPVREPHWTQSPWLFSLLPAGRVSSLVLWLAWRGQARSEEPSSTWTCLMILAGKHYWQEVLISDVSFLGAPHQGALILACPIIRGVIMLPKVWSCPQMKNIPSCALCVNFELNPSVVISIISLSLLSALLVVYSLSVLSLNHVWQPLWQSTDFRAYCDIQPPYRKKISSYYMNCFLMRQFLSVNNFL